MPVFALTFGRINHYVAATDAQDAYTQGTNPDRFPDINYLPFEVNEVIVPGHTIVVTPDETDEEPARRGGRPRKQVNHEGEAR